MARRRKEGRIDPRITRIDAKDLWAEVGIGRRRRGEAKGKLWGKGMSAAGDFSKFCEGFGSGRRVSA